MPFRSVRFRTLLPFVCLLSLLVLPAVAQDDAPVEIGRKTVGELKNLVLSTQHPYVGGIDQEFEVHHPGATYVKVHFSKFDLALGDRLIVTTPDGAERYVFAGKGYKSKGEDFWVTSVLGDRAILRLESANPAGGYGFDVDYYAHGIEPLFPPVDDDPSTLSVCGPNDWRDAECYATSHPTEYERGKSAVVVLFNGTENCTGVKVGCPNQILTNEHCVTSQGEVDVTEVRFEFQRSACGSGTISHSEAYLGDLAIQDNFTLDYMLLTVQGASDNYEPAEIDNRLPAVGERIYITGHPAGNPKQFSIEDSQSPTGLCRADLSPTDGRGTDTDVGYFCDTTGGSSGSPVWSGDTHKLIALHHFGGCANSGVRMDLIYPEIESLLTPCCDNPPNTPTATATANGDNRIDIDWDDSALDTVTDYLVKRSRSQGGPYDVIATVSDSSPGVAGGASYQYVDTDVSGDITYYYVVSSTDGERCHSEDSSEVSALATGDCTLPPAFAGAASASASGSSICTIDVAWPAATDECGGPVIYNVHRSTVPDFVPTGSNAIAAGVPSTNFQDINQLVPSTTYYYKVRAMDTANGVIDANDQQVSAVTSAGCTTASSCPENPFVNVTPEGPMTVCQGDGPELTADLTGGTGGMSYQWLRNGQPIAGANGPTYLPTDLGTHSYNVRVSADACPDEVFDGLDTELTRVNTPFFGGIGAAINPQDNTCTVDLSWGAATTVCDGPIDYAVYRSTTSPVTLTPDNLLVGGLTGLGFTDTHDLQNEQAYHYRVQARDASTGQWDGNGVEASAAPDGPNNGLQPFYDDSFEIPADFTNWTVTTGPGPHTCGDWAIGTNSGKRPSGGAGDYAIADNECAPILPRTSTTLTSPPLDLVIGGIEAVFLEADIRFEYSTLNTQEDATVEVWDGSQWIVVWSDTNTSVNTSLNIDVSQYALGNSEFRVRFDYQNATADRYFSIDDVAIVTDVFAPCSTAALGPVSVSSNGVVAGRGASDSIDVSWDATTCTAADYNLLYGDLTNVASTTLLGSECSLGTSGAFNWSVVPGGDLFFLVVGTDGVSTESSWGLDSGLGERSGSQASNQCGATTKDASNTCD